MKSSVVAPHGEESNALHNGAILIQLKVTGITLEIKALRSPSSARWASMMGTMMAAGVTIVAVHGVW